MVTLARGLTAVDESSQTTLVNGADGVRLAVEQAGEGPPVLLLHGLTATRRYVVMGSRALERSGHRVICYDARGHGQSAPGRAGSTQDAYGYDRLAADLEAVLDALEIERATLAGASMGAHTAVRLALTRPARVAALALITPAYDPIPPAPDGIDGGGRVDGRDGVEGVVGGRRRGREGEGERDPYAHWDALARGLREDGIDGFLAAYDLQAIPERWRSTVAQVIRQRLSAHEHLDAIAEALEAVPRSRPFESFADLHRIDVPALVVASRDEADPGHPLAVSEQYARAIPGARLLVEEPEASPIAWQGGRLSRAIGELMQHGTESGRPGN
jgi:pimeloyl-ACP methyl ester carboxylesterase